MQKSIKGSWGIVMVAFLAFLLPFFLMEDPDRLIRVAGFKWNCDNRPCRVEFTLENLTGGPLTATVEIRGYNFSSDLEMPRPRILVGKREFKESVKAGDPELFFEEVKFTRYPDELEIKVIEAKPDASP